jgi:hypothetical protein
MLGRQTEARSFLTSASNQRPFSSSETRLTAEVLFRSGYAEDGWAVLTAGVRADPQDAAIRFDMARYLHLGNKADLALPHYREAAKLQPSNPVYALGWALIRVERVGDPAVLVQELDRYSDAEIRDAYTYLQDLPGAPRLGQLLQDRLGTYKH